MLDPRGAYVSRLRYWVGRMIAWVRIGIGDASWGHILSTVYPMVRAVEV